MIAVAGVSLIASERRCDAAENPTSSVESQADEYGFGGSNREPEPLAACDSSLGARSLSESIREYRWTQVTAHAAFAPRDGAGAMVYKDRMWLIGGWNPKDKEHFPLMCNNEVWSSTDGRDWTLVKPNTFGTPAFDPENDWEGRHTAGYVVFKNRMWILGGDPLQGHYQPDVWSSEDGKNWRWENRGNPAPWGQRVLFYTVVFHDKIWVMGGQKLPPFAPGPEEAYRDIWNSSDGVHWGKVEPRKPYWLPRGIIEGSAVFKDRIWILGGGVYETPGHPDRLSYNDVWSSSDGVEWTRHLESAPWAPRTYHSVAVFDGELWVLQGFLEQMDVSGNRNDVWHSPDGVHWTQVPDTPWKARHATSVFVYDNALWVVAGKNMQPDVWKLTRVK